MRIMTWDELFDGVSGDEAANNVKEHTRISNSSFLKKKRV